MPLHSPHSPETAAAAPLMAAGQPPQQRPGGYVDPENPENVRRGIKPIKPIQPGIMPTIKPVLPTTQTPGYVDPQNPSKRPTPSR